MGVVLALTASAGGRPEQETPISEDGFSGVVLPAEQFEYRAPFDGLLTAVAAPGLITASITQPRIIMDIVGDVFVPYDVYLDGAIDPELVSFEFPETRMVVEMIEAVEPAFVDEAGGFGEDLFAVAETSIYESDAAREVFIVRLRAFLDWYTLRYSPPAFSEWLRATGLFPLIDLNILSTVAELEAQEHGTTFSPLEFETVSALRRVAYAVMGNLTLLPDPPAESHARGHFDPATPDDAETQPGEWEEYLQYGIKPDHGLTDDQIDLVIIRMRHQNPMLYQELPQTDAQRALFDVRLQQWQSLITEFWVSFQAPFLNEVEMVLTRYVQHRQAQLSRIVARDSIDLDSPTLASEPVRVLSTHASAGNRVPAGALVAVVEDAVTRIVLVEVPQTAMFESIRVGDAIAISLARRYPDGTTSNRWQVHSSRVVGKLVAGFGTADEQNLIEVSFIQADPDELARTGQYVYRYWSEIARSDRMLFDSGDRVVVHLE